MSPSLDQAVLFGALVLMRFNAGDSFTPSGERWRCCSDCVIIFQSSSLTLKVHGHTFCHNLHADLVCFFFPSVEGDVADCGQNAADPLDLDILSSLQPRRDINRLTSAASASPDRSVDKTPAHD